jgi:serine/threonine protein kinase
MKIMNRADGGTKQAFETRSSEGIIMTTFHHPGIMHAESVIETSDLLCIVMEKGETLSTNTKLDAKNTFRQILQAVNHLHEAGYAHGDLKLENALMTEGGSVKLIDFGFARPVGMCNCQTSKGTLQYAAPELFRKSAFSAEKVDVWALGILLFVLFADQHPFGEGTDRLIAQRICTGQLTFPSWLDADVKRLVQRMTALNPGRRPAVREVLEDPFFREDEGDALKERTISQLSGAAAIPQDSTAY